MISDERDFVYKVIFKVWHGSSRVRAVRYFSTLREASQFAHQFDWAEVRRVTRNVADMIIVGNRIYGRDQWPRE